MGRQPGAIASGDCGAAGAAAAPTNDGQTLTIIWWPKAAFHEVRADIEGNFLKSLDLAPGLAGRVRNGRRSERFRGTADTPNFYRKPYGPAGR